MSIIASIWIKISLILRNNARTLTINQLTNEMLNYILQYKNKKNPKNTFFEKIFPVVVRQKQIARFDRCPPFFQGWPSFASEFLTKVMHLFYYTYGMSRFGLWSRIEIDFRVLCYSPWNHPANLANKRRRRLKRDVGNWKKSFRLHSSCFQHMGTLATLIYLQIVTQGQRELYNNTVRLYKFQRLS